MITALFYLIPILFVLFFANYTKWQIIDEDDGAGYTTADVKWHRAGLYMRAMVVFAMIGWLLPSRAHWEDLVLLLPILAIEWDISINLFRGRGWLDVGVGGWDGKIGKKKWLLYLIWLIVSIIIFINAK